jgi:hypothetical protein
MPEPSPRARELRISEPGVRRLQTAIESICGAESLIRRGVNADSSRAVHTGLDVIRRALPAIADVLLFARPADIRPELSVAYLHQASDDLVAVEQTARIRGLDDIAARIHRVETMLDAVANILPAHEAAVAEANAGVRP